MHSRFSAHLLICAALILALASVALAQGGGAQSELSPLQRLDVMRSKLDSMRRSLNGAISSIEPKTANEGENRRIGCRHHACEKEKEGPSLRASRWRRRR